MQLAGSVTGIKFLTFSLVVALVLDDVDAKAISNYEPDDSSFPLLQLPLTFL